MPRGSSFESIQSNYREIYETATIKSVGSIHLDRTVEAEDTGSERSELSNYHHYSNINYDQSNSILSKYFNSNKANDLVYENLCSGCGYGVFKVRGKLCNFCQNVVNGYIENNSNIHENICDKCSEVYSGDECLICSKNNNVNKADNACMSNSKSTSKKFKKTLLRSLFGSFKRVKSFNEPPDKVKASIRKIQIVHNIDGYDNVFRTNETFDLSRICELKRLKLSTSDYHIYGKLRGSDDHLRTPFKFVKHKSQSDHYLSSATCSGKTIFRSSSINRYDLDDNNLSVSAVYLNRVRNCVSEWMTSLRCETHDYYSFGAPDTRVCSPKSIPASFNTSVELSDGALSLLFYPKQLRYTTDPNLTEAVDSLRLFPDESIQSDLAYQMVNEFKVSLMEKQQAHSTQNNLRTKRQGIYLKLDGFKSKQDNNYSLENVGDNRNCLPPSSSAQSQAIHIEQKAGQEKSRSGMAHQLNKRCCIYEKTSEFVSDILQAFDLFHRDTVVPEKNEEGEVEVCEQANAHEIVHRANRDSELFCPEIDIERITHHLLLSKSLNKIVINYDICLKVFLDGIALSPHLAYFKYSTLSKIFYRFYLFLDKSKRNAQIQTSAVSNVYYPLASENIREIDYIPATNTEVHSNTKSMLSSGVANSMIMTVPTATTITNTKEEEEEHIYQPIWKFMTVGEVQENYITEEYYDHLPRNCESSSSTAGTDIKDHDEWEPDDEFTFTTVSVKTTKSSLSGSTITGYASSISNLSIASTFSVTHHIFRNICIFYSPQESKIRAVIYDYDRNRCSSYFAQQAPIKTIGRGTNASPTITMITSVNYLKRPSEFNCEENGLKNSSESGGRMFADSVQAWKYMLLDVNNIEDEEDMIVSEIQILKAQVVKEMDSSPPPVGILQRFKSISSGNLLDVPIEEDKKSITERMRNKLQRGVFKLQTRLPKESKKGRNIFRRYEATSLYLEDGMQPKYPIFNARLECLEMNETSYPDVPRFVVDCIEYIEQKDCIQMDGLYRASGNKVAIDDLKQKLTESYIYDPKLLVTDDIHTLASLLKLFFRELGSPLIPQDIYQRLSSIKNLMETSALESLRTTFKDMKNPNHATLKFLIKHLTTVAHYSNENRMPASNLAIVWGPCILSANQIEYDIARMNTLAKVLIENYDQIFGDNERLVS